MTQIKEIYKCEICGNIVEVLHTGQGELVCCGQPMSLQQEKKQGEGSEKHIPVLEKKGDNYVVNVGETSHPMEEKHYIEWIEVIFENNKSYRKSINLEDKAEMTFKSEEKIILLRSYCNIHGLWVSNLD